MLSIGRLSELSGVKVPTLRYYEHIGLIDPPTRSAGNQRRFERSALDRVRFIRRGRDLGLSIAAIQDLIELAKTPHMHCQDAHNIAGEHLGDIEQRIAHLKELQQELARIAAVCEQGTIGKCKVLETLSNHTEFPADQKN